MRVFNRWRSSLLDYAGGFVDRDELARCDVLKVLYLAAWPFHCELCCPVLLQPEREREIALGAVTRSAVDGLPLFTRSALNPHDRSKGTPI